MTREIEWGKSIIEGSRQHRDRIVCVRHSTMPSVLETVSSLEKEEDWLLDKQMGKVGHFPKSDIRVGN